MASVHPFQNGWVMRPALGGAGPALYTNGRSCYGEDVHGNVVRSRVVLVPVGRRPPRLEVRHFSAVGTLQRSSGFAARL